MLRLLVATLVQPLAAAWCRPAAGVHVRRPQACARRPEALLWPYCDVLPTHSLFWEEAEWCSERAWWDQVIPRPRENAPPGVM